MRGTGLILGAFLLLIFCSSQSLYAQSDSIPPTKTTTPSYGAWFGVYTTYGIGKKWGYYGEYHARLTNGFGSMGQIYLRFGAMYRATRKIDLTVGIVTPIYWAPDQDDPNLDKVLPQFRFWEQALFRQYFPHLKLMHQLRLEQRYSREFEKGEAFHWTFRFRYKFCMYILLNNREFDPNTVYLVLYDEIFMQAGKSIVYDHFEDNRAFAGVGYKFDNHCELQLGYMNTFRHDGAPWLYESRHILRLNFLHRFDFKTKKQKEEEAPID